MSQQQSSLRYDQKAVVSSSSSSAAAASQGVGKADRSRSASPAGIRSVPDAPYPPFAVTASDNIHNNATTTTWNRGGGPVPPPMLRSSLSPSPHYSNTYISTAATTVPPVAAAAAAATTSSTGPPPLTTGVAALAVSSSTKQPHYKSRPDNNNQQYAPEAPAFFVGSHDSSTSNNNNNEPLQSPPVSNSNSRGNHMNNNLRAERHPEMDRSGKANSKNSIIKSLPRGGGVNANSNANVNSSSNGDSSDVNVESKQRTVHPSRVQFCPVRANLYACTNCLPPSNTSSTSNGKHASWENEPRNHPIAEAGAGAGTASTVKYSTHHNTQPKKLGPILLELRQLDIVTDMSHRQQGQQLFSSSTVGISRGNPQLGTSVASTCLSFHPSMSTAGIGGGGGTVDPFPVELLCATGLTTGALCLHNFQQEQGSTGNEYEQEHTSWSSSVENYTPRHHRMASSVAWRPRDTQHVAIGLVGGVGAGGGGTGGGGLAGPRRGVGGGARAAGGGDREFCCLVWDVEVQTHSATHAVVKGTTMTPVFKLSHNAGVASLAWLLDGQTLAVGCQQRTVQLYDLRVSGTSSPPVSTWAHSEAVNGIEVDPHRPQVFASFSQSPGEPVKLWDIRRMDSSLGEIKTSSYVYNQKQESMENQDMSTSGPVVSAVQWSPLHAGSLSVAMGDSIQHYDTTSSGSRPVLTHITYASDTMLDLAIHPDQKVKMARSTEKRLPEEQSKYPSFSELYQLRMLAVLADGSVRDVPKYSTGALAVSKRDGRVVNGLGCTLRVGSTTDGPSSMESLHFRTSEDISATMMRRAKCRHLARYSMGAAANIQMLAAEEQQIQHGGNSITFQPHREELLRLWSWIERIESLSQDRDESVVSNKEKLWPAKGLVDAGVLRLLRLDKVRADGQAELEAATYSDSLCCNTYDSPPRRAALIACGWTGRLIALNDVMADCEALGEFERSAALAVWHGDIGAAVEALQRGAGVVRYQVASGTEYHNISPQYAETLQLVSMCIAGFGGMDPQSSSSSVWRRACSSLLHREDLAKGKVQLTRVAYLRGICTFLINIGLDGGLDKVLYDKHLSLCDRVAFACHFLEKSDLKIFLTNCIKKCQRSGYLEGLIITGMDKYGIGILQSYVDETGDVQSAGLVSSRVILPMDWASERRICSEWLESYRDLLNTWQMWQSRAMFDVDRAELLRRLKGKKVEDMQTSSARGGYHQGRRGHPSGRGKSYAPSSKLKEPEALLPAIPAQLDARCNYCSTSLSGLRRQEGIANQWLSRLKPVLSCCPQCRKPLPRCSICLLSMGCLNPYMELKRERSRGPRMGTGLMPSDDLSSLANLPFAEWFTWCMRCKHGGHAHHLVGWFADHDVCPVSGCNCNCQFDGIRNLNRPALNRPDANEKT